jgi:hypothetical protein
MIVLSVARCEVAFFALTNGPRDGRVCQRCRNKKKGFAQGMQVHTRVKEACGRCRGSQTHSILRFAVIGRRRRMFLCAMNLGRHNLFIISSFVSLGAVGDGSWSLTSASGDRRVAMSHA